MYSCTLYSLQENVNNIMNVDCGAKCVILLSASIHASARVKIGIGNDSGARLTLLLMGQDVARALSSIARLNSQ